MLQNDDPSPKNTWKCKDGTMISIADMTDLHLENSIVYFKNKFPSNEREKGWILKQLQNLDREHHIRFFAKTELCNYCKELTMTRFESYDYDESWFPKTRYHCNKCGSTGPKVDNYRSPS